MKLLMLIGFLLVSSISCKKEASPKVKCSFFPLFKGEKIIYSSAAVGNLSPGQSPYVRDLQGNVLSDSVIFIDNYGFVLRNCETESVFIRYSGSEFPIVENLKDNGLIFSDAKYTVTQENYSQTKIYSIISTVKGERLMTVDFVPGKGVTDFTVYSSGKPNKEFYLKE